MEKYTIEEIHYNLDIAKDCLSENFVSLVCKALTYLDKKIVDKVSDKVLFFSSDFIRETTACHLILNSYAKTRRRIIFLSDNLFEKPEQEAIQIILQEVAYFYLNHKQCFDLSEEEINKQKQEAETLALKWLNKKYRRRFIFFFLN